MSMLDSLKELSKMISDVTDPGVAKDLTKTYEDLVVRSYAMSSKYWRLVRTLAAVEQERDMLRLKLDDDMPLV